MTDEERFRELQKLRDTTLGAFLGLATDAKILNGLGDLYFRKELIEIAADFKFKERALTFPVKV